MIVNKPYSTEQYAELAIYCNENDCHIEDKGDYLESVQNIHPPLTRDEIKQQRKFYREANIDDNTAERSRRLANKTWTEEDEQAYLELDRQVTEYIEANFPYPTESEN